MSRRPLKGITVLDFSHRLPGPLSTLQLTHLGARVIKIEDKNFGDPFDGGSFDEMDSSFSDWYRTLNENKLILKLDLAKDRTELEELIKEASIVLMGLPTKVQRKFSLEYSDFQKLRDHGVFLEMTSSKEKEQGMHDLNAIAQSGLLELHLNGEKSKQSKWIAPPFLPVAGICFASHIATESLANLIAAQRDGQWIARKVALEEAVQYLMSPLFSSELRQSTQRQFLHNGRYPCYAIYPLSDKGHLAIASVEEKYWNRFCEAFKIPIEAKERFKNEEALFLQVAAGVKKLSYNQAKEICSNLDACVTLID